MEFSPGPIKEPYQKSQEPPPTSPAKLGNISVQPGTHLEEKNQLSPSDVQSKTFPKENIEQIHSGLQEFPKTVDYVKSHLTHDEVLDRTMLQMAEVLDNTIGIKFSERLAHDIKHAQKNSTLTGQQSKDIEENLKKKFTDSILFFITADERKGGEFPLQRMAATFTHLPPSTDETFLQGCKEFAERLVRLAFEQQRDNPEQFVSHGFDHSLNVANYTRDVLNMNPQIVTAMSKKYQISEGEAKFLLEQVALLHDTGYPCLGCRSKAVHGISGADLILPMQRIFGEIIKSPHVEQLFSDFRNAILFHSADKIESQFGAKIHTTMGVFLANPKSANTDTTKLSKDIVTILSNFYDPAKNPSDIPRFTVEIYVQDEEEQKAIMQALEESQERFEEIAQGKVELPKVTVHSGTFQGRYADLEFNKDRLIGLEFSITDLLDNPLNMIRLVDNMDMRQTRKTLTQSEPTFKEIYTRLGDNRAISIMATTLENWERTVDAALRLHKGDSVRLNERIAEETIKTMDFLKSRIMTDMEKLPLDDLEKSLKENLNEMDINSITTPKEARNFLNKTLIETIFKHENWKNLSTEKKEAVKNIGMLQSSYDLRHFGGTEAIKEVQLKSIKRLESEESIPCVLVTVDRKMFEDLNEIKVFEEGMEIGVGEYQIWRASDAYRSIALGGTSVQLQVVDENGQSVECIINKNI